MITIRNNLIRGYPELRSLHLNFHLPSGEIIPLRLSSTNFWGTMWDQSEGRNDFQTLWTLNTLRRNEQITYEALDEEEEDQESVGEEEESSDSTDETQSSPTPSLAIEQPKNCCKRFKKVSEPIYTNTTSDDAFMRKLVDGTSTACSGSRRR